MIHFLLGLMACFLLLELFRLFGTFINYFTLEDEWEKEHVENAIAAINIRTRIILITIALGVLYYAQPVYDAASTGS